jgi:hypothetical protein
MKKSINFLLGIGERCNNKSVRKSRNILSFTTPFDNHIFDIGTSLEIINKKFINFLSDWVLIKTSNNTKQLMYPLNTNEINKEIIKLKGNLMTNMESKWDNHHVYVNQNYLPKTELPTNIYFWEKLFISIHYDFTDENILKLFNDRILIFNNIYNNYKDKLALFYVTKLIDVTIKDYLNKCINYKIKYSINTSLIIILNTSLFNINEKYIYNEENDILIISRNIGTYESQMIKYPFDSNTKDGGFDIDTQYIENNELEIINNYFELNLIESNNQTNNYFKNKF